MADNGFIWLLTPKRGRPGYVEPSDIAEAAPTAGLAETSLATVGSDWGAARLVARSRAASDADPSGGGTDGHQVGTSRQISHCATRTTSRSRCPNFGATRPC